jgi:serine/threonine protein kinase
VLHDKPAVVKIFKQKDPSYMKEITLLSLIHDDNIVSCLGADTTSSNLGYAMPYFPGGSLRELIEKSPAVVDKLYTKIALEAAKAVSVLSSGGLVHRGIKPEAIRVRRYVDTSNSV